CDQIAIINNGQIIAFESKQDLLARGLGSKLLVRAGHKIESVPRELRQRVVRLEGNELELTLHRDRDSVMDILDRLRATSMQIDHVSVISDSLQDVFVQMTGTEITEAD
ncbi:MAG: hypothetical protein KJP04_09245, partial [Arenicella sp.]|nr:hypothetical protein [Arenicella sp.]